MAKDVITRFKLETTGYDSKLKQAAKGLSDYSKTATQAKEGFNQFTKANVDAAKALGTIATSTTTAKDRVKELVGAYNEAAKAYEALSDEHKQSDFAKALAGSLTQLQQRIRETKQEMQGLGDGMKGGGLFSGLGDKMGGALQVFAGNMMTKAAGAVMDLGSEITDCIRQGIELARQGEGIRNAFERLGRGDILEGLREATHGTVTDIELMKAAVKFNDFKLPVEELGTMLAFAQQKAKDTGQSVDYMVDSIVTGLGRKSLMILDNLGLSANEVKEKMKETGDMTTAVGAIIREQMSKAGDYVETAADRAAQANVSLQNKMEELGRLFAPLQESSTQLWTSMKIAILDVVSGPLARLLNGLTEAGRLKNMIDDLNGRGSDGQTHTQRALGALGHYSGDRNDLYNRQVSRYNQLESQAWREANRLREQLNSLRRRQRENGAAGNIQPLINDAARQLERAENRARAWQQIRSDYQNGARSILNPSAGNTNTPSPVVSTKNRNTANAKTVVDQTEMQLNTEKIQKLTQEYISASEERRTAIREEIKGLQKLNNEIQNLMDEAQGKTSPTRKLTGQDISGINKSGSILGNDFMTPGHVVMTYKELNEEIERLIKLRDEATTPEEWRRLNEAVNSVKKRKEDYTGQGDSNKKKPEKTQFEKDLSATLEVMGRMNSGISSIVGGIEQMGVEIPDGISKVISVMQGITSILTGINTLLSVKSLIPGLAGGGFIHAADGIRVPGNTYSMDQVPAMLNSGEVVLNRAQAGNLASQLSDGNSRGGYQPSHISGEQIYIAMNRYLKRTGRGEIVTWK